MHTIPARIPRAVVSATLALLALPVVTAGDVVLLSGPDGLSAEAEFTLADAGATLVVRLRNTSTGVPGTFLSSDQLISGVSFDFGGPGVMPGDNVILGGVAEIGPTSMSMNFDTGSYGPGADIGGEWGFGNFGGSANLTNFVSGNGAGQTLFGGPNLDGPAGANGPQAGLATAPPQLSLGGLGAIADEIIATLAVDPPLRDLGFLSNSVRVEFGSDAAFLGPLPCANPATVVPLGAPCGATLTSTPPILGSTAILTVDGNSPGAPGAVFTSAGTSSFLFQGCEIVLNPVNIQLLLSFVTDANGDFVQMISVPTTPDRCGDTVPLQAAVFSTSGPLPSGEITNGILVTFGS